MTEPDEYLVILFESVSYALKAEKILKQEGVPHKLIPVPKHISPNCGVCLRLTMDFKERAEHVLRGRVEIADVRPL
jgi:hypothetical protein